MQERQPGRCPQCGGPLQVSELHCPRCELAIRGVFQPCPFCQLPPDQRRFLETFVACRGVIRQIEKELGISYPTVRTRIDQLLEALHLGESSECAITPRDVLLQLERGQITVDEAIASIQRVRGQRA